MSITKTATNINTLKINYLSESMYQDALSNSQINENELYFTPSLDITTTILNIFYPVGSYYETSDITFNPNNTWGGTWVLETEGQVHISGSVGGTYQITGATGASGAGTSDGGATTHNHGGADGDVTLTGAQSGNQALTYVDTTYSKTAISKKPGTSTATTTGYNITGTANNKTIAAKNATTAHSHTISSDSNMPPYIIVNRWHRTA